MKFKGLKHVFQSVNTVQVCLEKTEIMYNQSLNYNT